MVSLHNLPPEVLVLIFKQLRTADLLKVALAYREHVPYNVRFALSKRSISLVLKVDTTSDESLFYLGPRDSYRNLTLYHKCQYFEAYNDSVDFFFDSFKCFSSYKHCEIIIQIDLGYNDKGKSMAGLLLKANQIAKRSNISFRLSIFKFVKTNHRTRLNLPVNLLKQFNWKTVSIFTDRFGRFESFKNNVVQKLPKVRLDWLEGKFDLEELYLGEKLIVKGNLMELDFPNLKTVVLESCHAETCHNLGVFLNCHSPSIKNLYLRNFHTSSFKEELMDKLELVALSGNYEISEISKYDPTVKTGICFILTGKCTVNYIDGQLHAFHCQQEFDNFPNHFPKQTNCPRSNYNFKSFITMLQWILRIPVKNQFIATT